MLRRFRGPTGRRWIGILPGVGMLQLGGGFEFFLDHRVVQLLALAAQDFKNSCFGKSPAGP